MPSLYRFTNFESFVDIIQRKELTLVSPSLWPDPYEGYLFAALKTSEGRIRVTKELAKYKDPESVQSALDILSKMDAMYFGQCWTKKPESDALWRIYSHDNMSVRVEVDQTKFFSLDRVFIDDVVYLLNLDLEGEVRAILSKDGTGIRGRRPLLTKRDEFRHEDEVRIIVHGDAHNDILVVSPPEEVKAWEAAISQALLEGTMFPEEADSLLATVKTKRGPRPKQVRISFAHIPEFIKSLMLHPLAPQWLNETLEEYCCLNDIRYLGKSKMYEFII